MDMDEAKNMIKSLHKLAEEAEHEKRAKEREAHTHRAQANKLAAAAMAPLDPLPGDEAAAVARRRNERQVRMINVGVSADLTRLGVGCRLAEAAGGKLSGHAQAGVEPPLSGS